MGPWFYTAVIAVAALCLTACGKKGCYEPGQLQSFGNPSDATDIYLDASVPSDQRSAIQGDLERLASVQLPAADKTDKCVLGIADTSPATMSQWLKTRVRVIVGESYDWKNKATVSSLDSTANFLAPDDLSAIVTVMFNLGAYLYLEGKKASKVYTLPLSTSSYDGYYGKVEYSGRADSPRVGWVQIGEGMFSANRVKGSSTDAAANSFLRLAVTLHEARHSDGNGDNVAFAHALCEEGDYEGKHACERYLNGPYAVQSHMVAEYLQVCTECSSTEKEAMARLAADYQSRVTKDAEYADDTPESL